MIKTLGAYIVHRNDNTFLKGCIERLKGVDQLVLIEHGVDFPYTEPVNMGELRDFAISKLTTDWVWIVDADEWYEEGAVEKIKEFINSTDAISARVHYHQLAWRNGYEQANFEHYPDRLYRRDVLDKTDGVLPLDMVKVKKEFYEFRPFLEYDNADDKSFENPKQPILDVWFYHLARTRGYNQELTKNIRYQHFIHPDWNEQDCLEMAKLNQWTTGLYDIKPIKVPFEIPPIENPKVSVVIPNFQYKQYIEECVDSVKKQTYPAYEIIVVDDGSFDNSKEIIDRLDVIKIYKENGGVASARNAGAGRATGDYLLFLDADDCIAPNYIEETLKLMKGDIQIVSTDLEFFGDQTGIHEYPTHSHKIMLKWQNIPSACALIDRRVFELTGGFDITAWYEDWDFWLRCYQLGFNFAKTYTPLMKYRKHGESRINMLDAKQEYGFNELRQKYGIQR